MNKKNYIVPIVYFELIETDDCMKKDSWPPDTDTDNAAGDSGNGNTDKPVYGGDGDGGDMAKQGYFDFSL